MLNQEQVRLEHLRTELSVYRNIENWGLTLIVGGIGAMSYQLVEWTKVSGPLREAPPTIIFGPLVVGIFGMIFLRVVNFRSAQVWIPLNQMVGEDITRRWWLGLIISWLPLGAGVGGSSLVKWSRCVGDCSGWFYSATTFCCIAVISAILTQVVYLCMQRRSE